MRFLLISFLGVILLSGCLLNQDGPDAPGQPVSATVGGLIKVEDYDGPEKFAFIQGQFTEKAAAASFVAKSALRAASQTKCQYSQKTTTRAAASTFISVGQLGFGPALQSTLTEIPQAESGAYYRELDADIPSGVYLAAAKGDGKIPAFQEYISVPERITEPRVGNIDFEDTSIELQKGEDTIVSWRRKNSVSGADVGVMVFEVSIKLDNEVYGVFCAASEGGLTAEDGRTQWTIPSVEFDQLPDQTIGFFYLSRVYIRDPATKNIKVDLQGWRTRYTPASILAP